MVFLGAVELEGATSSLIGSIILELAAEISHMKLIVWLHGTVQIICKKRQSADLFGTTLDANRFVQSPCSSRDFDVNLLLSVSR